MNSKVYVSMFLLGILISGGSFSDETKDLLLLDDFTDKTRTSSHGTNWKFYSDQVMGGVSDGKHQFIKTDSQTIMRLEGTVRLENNGGFIQIALPLKKGWSNFDASSYKGIRITVRGNGEPYALHLRTNQTIMPWRYYAASFDTNNEWQTIDIPFSEFKPDKGYESINTKKLKRLGVVAAFKAMDAQLDVSKIELYRE